ncbi:MAG TPA: MFS transporter, partial [Candidatus Eisenbacteria bacterium]|nr:MFS transporter [Candidatus Eisenbacteria bacterium]
GMVPARRIRPGAAIGALHAVLVLGCLGMGLAPSWGWFAVGAVLAGAGFGGLVVYVNTIFARAFPKSGVLMVNVLNAVFGMGSIAGPLLIGLAGRERFQLVLAGAGLVAIPAVVVSRHGRTLEVEAEASPSGGLSVRALAGSTSLVLFVLFGFLYDGLETSVGGWEATHLTWLGFSVSSAAQLSAAFWAGLTAGRLVLPVLLAKRAPPSVITCCTGLGACALLAAMAPPAAPYAYAAAGFALGPVLPTAVTWLTRAAVVPQRAGALFFTGAMSGNTLIPGLVGLLSAASRPAATPAGLGALCVVCLVVNRVMRRAIA